MGSSTKFRGVLHGTLDVDFRMDNRFDGDGTTRFHDLGMCIRIAVGGRRMKTIFSTLMVRVFISRRFVTRRKGGRLRVQLRLERGPHMRTPQITSSLENERDCKKRCECLGE